MEKYMICPDCGQKVERRAANQKRCRECAYEAHLKLLRNRYEPSPNKNTRCKICDRAIRKDAPGQMCQKCAEKVNALSRKAIVGAGAPAPKSHLSWPEMNKLCRDCGKTYGEIQVLLQTMTEAEIRMEYQKER